MNTRYLTVTRVINDQNISERMPSTVDSFSGMPCAGLNDSFRAYSGLVPMSPNTTPMAPMVSAPSFLLELFFITESCLCNSWQSAGSGVRGLQPRQVCAFVHTVSAGGRGRPFLRGGGENQRCRQGGGGRGTSRGGGGAGEGRMDPERRGARGGAGCWFFFRVSTHSG